MKRVIKYLFNLDDIVGMLAMTVTVGIIILNVLMRAILKESILWANEVAFMGFSWATFVGAAACYKRKMHIGVDMLVNVLPSKVKSVVVILIDLALIVFNVYFAYLSCTFAISAYVKPTSMLAIPYTYIDISATVGFVLMTIYSLIFLALDLGIKRENAWIEREDGALVWKD